MLEAMELEKKFKAMTPEERCSLLSDHCISCSFSVGDHVWCLHCEKWFLAENIAVDLHMTAGMLGLRETPQVYFKCPNDCSGSPLDFADLPWWDSELTENDGEGYQWIKGKKPY